MSQFILVCLRAQKSSNEKSYESKKENNDNHLIKSIICFI